MNQAATESSLIIEGIQSILDTHEKYKSCYFWKSPSSASSRRSMEFNDDFTFEYAGQTFAVNQFVKCSCKNVYYKLSVEVDSVKKDIRSLKSVLKSLSGGNL